MGNPALDILTTLLRDSEITRRFYTLQTKNLTIEEVAERLNVSVRTLERRMEEGKWLMYRSKISGKLEMTPQQFEEQRKLITIPDHKIK